MITKLITLFKLGRKIAKSDILTFEVMEHSSWREDYLGDWIGVIRPKQEWKTEKIG